MITSPNNPQVRYVTQLNTKAKQRRKEGRFTAEGRKMFLEAPPALIRTVYLTETAAADPAVAEKISVGRLRFETVSDAVFLKMADTQTPQGILTVLDIPSYTEEELFRTEPGDEPLYAVLEDLQDPGNLGTILRTGEGAGLSGVLMTANCVDLFSPKTVRSTMGSVFRVPVLILPDIREISRLLKKHGVTAYAAHLKGTMAYDEPSYKGACAFLIGNEGNGLSQEAAACADCLINIPMKGQVESLNAAMAAGILMYEASRQRRR